MNEDKAGRCEGHRRLSCVIGALKGSIEGGTCRSDNALQTPPRPDWMLETVWCMAVGLQPLDHPPRRLLQNQSRYVLYLIHRLAMPKFTGAFLAEQVTVSGQTIDAIRDPIRSGQLGARVLPWTTALALVLVVDGIAGETFQARAEVVPASNPDHWMFFRNVTLTIARSGEQAFPIELGPMEFKEPGTYVFRVHGAGESVSITAALTRASGR